MADILTGATSPNSCSHWVVDGLDDGQPWSGLSADDTELLAPLTEEEKLTLRRLLLRRLRQGAGVTIPQLVGRVVRGEEATNVKVYQLIGPGAAITKTNIGTAYVNVSAGANGERTLVDFTGCTEFRALATVNLVGAGPFGIRIIRDSDSAILYENASIALTGERELDTDWQPLPGAATGLILVRVQAKSVTAADDPVFRRVQLAVR